MSCARCETPTPLPLRHWPTRGNGIDAALVEEAERWAAARALGTIHVRSNVLRERAHRFYERRGYVREKSAHASTKPVRAT